MADEDDTNWGFYDAEDFVAGTKGSKRKPKKRDEGYDCGDVTVIRTTDAALLVRGSGLSSDPFGIQDPNEESWVPRSQVHPASTITADAQVRDEGKLFITTWFAKQRGLV